ncbi:MAG: hypothetical protein FJ042_00590 [Candidatus Cloacimonetes bacterium]|nr:hypothetical protein [Candidatus Cloacimonadota bacterium]
MHKQRLFIMIAAVVGAVAALLPWASAFGFTVSGISGDGILTLILFIICIALLLIKDKSRTLSVPFNFIVAGAGGASGLVGLFDIYRMSELSLEIVGIGLWLTLIAGIAVPVLVFVIKDNSVVPHFYQPPSPPYPPQD